MPHPLLAYPEQERVSYLSIIAELSYVDGNFDDQEKNHLLNVLLVTLQAYGQKLIHTLWMKILI